MHPCSCLFPGPCPCPCPWGPHHLCSSPSLSPFLWLAPLLPSPCLCLFPYPSLLAQATSPCSYLCLSLFPCLCLCRSHGRVHDLVTPSLRDRTLSLPIHPGGPAKGKGKGKGKSK